MEKQQTMSGRVALVTGGGRGIGEAIAHSLADLGVRVAICDIHDGAERVAAAISSEGQRAVPYHYDISDVEQTADLVNSVINEFGRLDILVNNAGIGGAHGLLHEINVEDWDRTISVNLRGTFLATKYAMPHLLEQTHSTIINIASTYGIIGAPLAPDYCATKGAIVNLTRQLAVDYGPLGVRINAVLPGYIDTDLGGRRANLPKDQAEEMFRRRETSAALQPLGRQATTTEVARVVAFLASDDASFMTGSIVTVDGGCTSTFYHG
ncbi:SDR family NAD(P)-dependent oxidoreductase [Ferrimicrobium sp.]|uniref:SDR family NAD(P)-dependent oxidoreductase n=1 Tax=Ferrimicrobium sp. TaxID=2926050 RepID=UPI002617DF2E|nr:SDR family NAD(P)-dependent oxidoreductase [Ferrimicrobium sp.]